MEEESRRKMKEKFGLRQNIFKEFLAEFLGIFVLILFGCGAVAQTVLSKGALGEPLTIHVGFTLGVMMAVYMAGGVSGAHVNPAVSLAMVILGKLPLKKFPVYVVAQFLGAFAGSCAVFVLYYDALMDHTNGQFEVTGANATANIFASYPAKHLSVLNGFVDQVSFQAHYVLTDKKKLNLPNCFSDYTLGKSGIIFKHIFKRFCGMLNSGFVSLICKKKNHQKGRKCVSVFSPSVTFCFIQTVKTWICNHGQKYMNYYLQVTSTVRPPALFKLKLGERSGNKLRERQGKGHRGRRYDLKTS
uniref:Aquaporin 9 n=2 Tax=Nothobranchius TaxID=28779 RepID=A0A8C6LY50_NOTFU